MARPQAKELTPRELEIMHFFWERGELTIAELQELFRDQGSKSAYTTLATLVKILVDKGYLHQTNDQRPFYFRPIRSFDEVSGNFVSQLVSRVFKGSREQLLLRLVEDQRLTKAERARLQEILKGKSK